MTTRKKKKISTADELIDKRCLDNIKTQANRMAKQKAFL